MTGMNGPSGLAVEVASEFLLTKLGNPGGQESRNNYILQIYWAVSGRSYSLRFFIFQYGIMYHPNISAGNKSIYLMFWLLKLLLCIGSVETLAVLYTVLHLTVCDIFASILADLSLAAPTR